MKPEIMTRKAALRILDAVYARHVRLDEAIYAELGKVSLMPADRNFVRLLVMTCLRREGQIRDVLGRVMKKPFGSQLKTGGLILCLGAAQLLFLKTPPHAAINTAVELARAMRLDGLTGFVNGVLRAVARLENPLQGQDEVGLNTPQWLLDSWCAAYGAERAQAVALACLQEPPLDISVKSNPEKWAETLGGAVLETGTVRLKVGALPTELPGFKEGEWWVQGASASLPAQLFSDVKGLKVADICAAPGGKTAQLAHRGAQVVACDISEKRLRMLQENMRRLGFAEAVQTENKNASDIAGEGVFDAVLLDAPCSATGTLQRHPDIKLHQTPAHVAKLAAGQQELLRQALRLAKSGGEVVFATCSLQPEEGDPVITAVLADGLAEVLPLPEKWEKHRTPAGGMRLFPDQGYDGFYICLLRKK